jgi:hypothetical protein
MEITLTDQEIIKLIKERKAVPLTLDDFFSNLKEKRGHTEFDHIIPREDGSSFLIKLRQNRENKIDFSAILGYMPKEVNRLFRVTMARAIYIEMRLKKVNLFMIIIFILQPSVINWQAGKKIHMLK